MTFWAHCSHIKSDWSSKSVPRSQKHDMESFKTGSFQWFRMVFGWPGGGRRGGSYQIHSSTGGGHSWCSMVQHGAAWWPNHLSFLTSISLLAEDFELSVGQAEDSWTVISRWVLAVFVSADIFIHLWWGQCLQVWKCCEGKGKSAPWSSASSANLCWFGRWNHQLRLFKMKDFEAAAELYSSGISKFASRSIQRGDEVLVKLG